MVTVIEGSQILAITQPCCPAVTGHPVEENCMNSFVFYISAPLNLWPTLWDTRLEGHLLKSFSCYSFCDSAVVARGLF